MKAQLDILFQSSTTVKGITVWCQKFLSNTNSLTPLCYAVNNEESLYLLATCYYRSGKANQARCLLQSKGSRSPQCQYLLAKCCLDLNKYTPV